MKELYTLLLSDQINIILGVLAQVVIVIVGVMIASLARKTIKKTNIETNTLIDNSIEQLIFNAVNYTNQTLTEKLKEHNGGSLTEDEKLTVFSSTKAAVMKCLSTEQLRSLIKKYGDVSYGLDMLIEAYVNYSKKDTSDKSDNTLETSESETVIEVEDEQKTTEDIE